MTQELGRKYSKKSLRSRFIEGFVGTRVFDQVLKSTHSREDQAVHIECLNVTSSAKRDLIAEETVPS